MNPVLAAEDPDAYKALPAENVTLDQIVAANMRYWRKAAGLNQEELGKRLGWSNANVSAAERSADAGRERRRFDASTLAALADALGVPFTALFLPPADDGDGKRYEVRYGPGDPVSMPRLWALINSDFSERTLIANEYRERWAQAHARYMKLPSDDEEASPAEREALLDRLRRERSLLSRVLGEATRVLGETDQMAAELDEGANGDHATA